MDCGAFFERRHVKTTHWLATLFLVVTGLLEGASGCAKGNKLSEGGGGAASTGSTGAGTCEKACSVSTSNT